MTYNGFLWKLWRKIMGKTFDEWFEKHAVALRRYLDYTGDDKELKATVNLIWAASRQNMTTRDI